MKHNSVPTLPDGYTSLTPWIVSRSTAALIPFLEKVFGAVEVPMSRITNSENKIIHVAAKIGNAMILLFDSREGWIESPGFLNLYVDDIELVYNRALEQGAQGVTDITTLWFGEKVCRILDPFGNLWWINQRVEDIDYTAPGVMEKRADTDEAKAGIAYIQESLDQAMKIQKAFFFAKLRLQAFRYRSNSTILSPSGYRNNPGRGGC